MNAVADTGVASFIFKNDSRASFYEAQLIGLLPVVSFMTIAEMDAWALRHQWGPTRTARMEAFLQSRFTIVIADRGLCRLWAEVTTACLRAGRPIQTADAWIAATAIQLNAPLFTHNQADFAAVPGLAIVSANP